MKSGPAKFSLVDYKSSPDRNVQCSVSEGLVCYNRLQQRPRVWTLSGLKSPFHLPMRRWPPCCYNIRYTNNRGRFVPWRLFLEHVHLFLQSGAYRFLRKPVQLTTAHLFSSYSSAWLMVLNLNDEAIVWLPKVALLGASNTKTPTASKLLSVIEVAFLVDSGEMSAPVSRPAIAIVAHLMAKSSHRGASTSRKTVAKCASAWITNTYAIIHDANIRGQHLPSKEGEIFRIRTTPKPRPPGPTTSPSSCSAWSDWINEYANTAGGDYETKTVKQLNPMGFCLNEKIVDIDCCDVKNNRPWTETRDKKYGLLTRQRSSLLSYPSR